VSTTPGIDDPDERAARVAGDEELARSAERHRIGAFLDRWLAQPMFAGVPGDAPGLADRRHLTPAYVAHCLRVLGTGAMPPMWSQLDELLAPVTIVTGSHDTKFTDTGKRIPGQHRIVDCGHAVLLEQPDALASILNEQLR
jgi:pimeloyl-ACP methyl ester carboxylesterase